MKKFYYFSEKSLNFLEIKHFKEKLIAIFTASVIIFSSLVLGIFYLVSTLVNNDNNITNLRNENKELKQKVVQLSEKYSVLENDLLAVTETSNALRLATNLTPINPEERILGVGGSSSVEKYYNQFSGEVSDALEYV